MILAGDIGGTNTRLALFEEESERLKIVEEQRFSSRDHASLEEIVTKCLSPQRPPIKYACFGVAGPIKEGRCEATNLPWLVDARVLLKALGLDTVSLINDLEANAYGVAVLEAHDFTILNKGSTKPEGNGAIIAAGTGLGEAGFYWDGQGHHPVGCEGGHTDFAPRNELEIELLRFLLTRYERVSYERILSGPGLHNIHQFLRDTGRGDEPVWLAEAMRQEDASAVISKAALDGRSELCVRALDLFVSLYGAEAGNLALKLMATGGVFVGGGIAPKIMRKLTDGTFMQAFAAKGRMKDLLESIPVRVILNEKTALLGAAHCARLRAAGKPLTIHIPNTGSTGKE
jgi:glucokinase